jgi:putative membrane protein
MREYLVYLLKGIAVGVANVIPGVSGGTIALITGIFERLIDSLKSFGLTALKLLLAGKWSEFVKKTDLYFLISLLVGVALAIVLLARVFDFLFQHYPVYIWSCFFGFFIGCIFFLGLILASIFYVGRTIGKWTLPVVISFLVGTAIALVLTFLTPATQNSNFFYLVVCGVVAVCSMILPGLSGSFVLILMGNYQMIAIEAINNRDLAILFPVALGAVFGLIAFSHLLSWVFKRYKDPTIAILTGFILGSLGVIWPWKDPVIQMFGEKEKVVGYMYNLPSMNMEFLGALLLMIVGIIAIALMENSAKNVEKAKD